MSRRQITFLEIDHINQLLPSADRAIEFYQRVYGAEIDSDHREVFGPYNNLLFKLGRTPVEVFSGIGVGHSFDRQLERFGPNWQAVLWRVPNLEEAIEIFEERGIPLVDVELEPDRRWAFTDPRATSFSIQFEDRDGWDTSPAPNALGITGLAGFTAAVTDAEATAAMFDDLIGNAEILYHEDRPRLNARAVGIRLGRYVMELLSPVGEGVISNFVERVRPRIRSATFRVESIAALEQRLAGHGIKLVEGDRRESVAIAPADNLGVMMQFCE